jgi:hypothetical protein
MIGYFFMADLLQLKEALFKNISLRLGAGIIDLELDPDHYNAAWNFAVATYRQRGQNAYEEAYMLLEIQQNQNSYILPQEVTKVRQAFRRTVGLETGPSATSFDPFSSAILNTYLLNYNYAGGLATYDLYAGYVELAARMFGGYVIYTFNSVTKEIQFVRDFKGTGERILLWTDNLKPEIVLIQDPQIGVWLSNWTLAQLKITIGEAREKYGTIAGPQGGTSLNGAAMKAEGAALQLALIEDLKHFVDGSEPYAWVQG